MRPGRLIVFEGIDGTGKSTQLALLADWLQEQGYDVVVTREPTDGVWGRKIRELYRNRAAHSLEEELELFIRDRQEHVDQVIQPALDLGKIVLSDRYYFSTAAYQGAAGCDPDEVFARNSFAPEPDLVVLLSLDPEAAMERITTIRGDRPDDFEQPDQLRRVAELFASFDHPAIRRIDAGLGIDEIQERIRAEAAGILPAPSRFSPG